MKADLHLHTTASDGQLTPRQLVKRAAELGLSHIAITDHDTVDGIEEALEAAPPQLVVIPGVEINTDIPEGEVHILGFFIHHRDKELGKILATLRRSRLERAQNMVTKLRELGMDIQWQRVLELTKGGSVGRPHIARAMLEKGYISSLPEAFVKYIGRQGPAYVERYKLTPEEAVQLVLKVSGVPVLAHPMDIQDRDDKVTSLKKAGLMGLEVYYYGYSPEIVEELLALVQLHHLAVTGGSDYHGLYSSIGGEVGSVSIPQARIQEFLALVPSSSAEEVHL
ncbi:MAG: PHP domain-containing protein [Chloroflexi bacterium]|nr:PHP domain-containing protein [Chloroflexota bacterium]